MDVCTICMEPQTTDSVCLFDCSHAFHTRCILTWREIQHGQCPNCRQPLNVCQHRANPMLEAHSRADLTFLIEQFRETVTRQEREIQELKGTVTALRMAHEAFPGQVWGNPPPVQPAVAAPARFRPVNPSSGGANGAFIRQEAARTWVHSMANVIVHNVPRQMPRMHLHARSSS